MSQPACATQGCQHKASISSGMALETALHRVLPAGNQDCYKRVAMVLTSALFLSRTGPKLLNAKVQDLASTFEHTAKTSLNLR